MQKIYSIIELNNYIKNLFDTDQELGYMVVKGEISNFKNHRSGHMYFSLKDNESQIKAVMFKNANSKLTFVPENGMRVVVKCSVTTYARDGVYQLYISSMEKEGMGDLHLAFEELKNKLLKEGLFDKEKKKTLPTFPKKIGVITSSNGAAIKDIINVIERRCPITKILLFPANVQGVAAEESLIKGLDYFDSNQNVDLVIIGRGGGSIEDLWGFNGEKLARRIFDFNIPIISAVGHEIDFTICDFVADKRAPTPSAAAELAVPDLKEYIQYLDILSDKLVLGYNNSIQAKENKFDIISNNVLYKYPDRIFSNQDQVCLVFENKIKELFKTFLLRKDNELSILANKLDTLSPLSILGRGYSIVSNKNVKVNSIKQVSNDDVVSIRFCDGMASALIMSIEGDINKNEI